MFNWKSISCAGWTTLFFLSLNVSSFAQDEALSVTIAVPKHHNHRSLNTTDHIHVLITNKSDEAIRLWSDKYSWGYFNLSFELIDEGGMIVGAISKKPRGWGKNFPDWLQIGPGESYVLNVDFFSEQGRNIWSNVPQPRGGAKPHLVKLRAVYEIQPDAQSAKHDVWTGKIKSAVETYAIW